MQSSMLSEACSLEQKYNSLPVPGIVQLMAKLGPSCSPMCMYRSGVLKLETIDAMMQGSAHNTCEEKSRSTYVTSNAKCFLSQNCMGRMINSTPQSHCSVRQPAVCTGHEAGSAYRAAVDTVKKIKNAFNPHPPPSCNLVIRQLGRHMCLPRAV
jgi:hypothetical protein